MKRGKSKTIKDMMEEFAKRIELPKEAIDKRIRFIYNGQTLDYKKNDSVERVLRNGVNIFVCDVDYIIGAK